MSSVAVKFGALRSPDGNFIGFDGRPAAVKISLAYKFQRLETNYIDLYQPARIDPAVPIEDTVGAIAQEAREVVQAHVDELVGQLTGIIESGISSREFKVWDPRESAHAVFNATIRFHHPAYASEWSSPDIDTDFAQVWRLVKVGLVHDEDV